MLRVTNAVQCPSLAAVSVPSSTTGEQFWLLQHLGYGIRSGSVSGRANIQKVLIHQSKMLSGLLEFLFGPLAQAVVLLKSIDAGLGVTDQIMGLGVQRVRLSHHPLILFQRKFPTRTGLDLLKAAIHGAIPLS